METVLTNAYTHLGKKSKLFETTPRKNLHQRNVIFLQNGVLKSL